MGGQQHQPGQEQRRFGRYLRQVRERRKLSLDAVEEMSAVYPDRLTKSHLSRIENGLAEPSFRKMFALSEIYGMPLTALAEQFELDLKREQISVEVEGKSVEQVEQEILGFFRSGHYLEALEMAQAVLDGDSVDEPATRCRFRQFRINSLIRIARYETAKSEVEALLNETEAGSEGRLATLQLFITVCLNLRLLTVASMALEEAHKELSSTDSAEVAANLHTLGANLKTRLGDHEAAAIAHREALSLYADAEDGFRVCMARGNLAGSLINLGRLEEALEHVIEAQLEAESSSFDRLVVYSQHLRGLIHFKQLDMETAQRWFIRANALARTREYASYVFCNCFYLWQIAKIQGDESSIRLNERTLRSLVGKVDDSLTEVQTFKTVMSEEQS